MSRGEFSAPGVDIKARHRKWGNGLDQMRIQNVEQRCRDLRKLGIQFTLNAAGQECKGFDEPFDMRIGRMAILQLKTVRHHWILPGELTAHLAQISEFV